MVFNKQLAAGNLSRPDGPAGQIVKTHELFLALLSSAGQAVCYKSSLPGSVQTCFTGELTVDKCDACLSLIRGFPNTQHDCQTMHEKRATWEALTVDMRKARLGLIPGFSDTCHDCQTI
jgi:hypothetical protein